MSNTSGIPMVVARPGALNDAIDAAKTSVRALAPETGVSRSTISNVASRPGYGIRKDKAERIAAALGVPARQLFVHRDGAELA